MPKVTDGSHNDSYHAKFTADEVGADIETHGHIAVTPETATQNPFTVKGAVAIALDDALEEPDDTVEGYHDNKALHTPDLPHQKDLSELSGDIEGVEEGTRMGEDKAVEVKDSLAEALDAIAEDAVPTPDEVPNDGEEEIDGKPISAITGKPGDDKAPDIPESMVGEEKTDENGLVYITRVFTVDPEKYISNNYRPKAHSTKAMTAKDVAKQAKKNGLLQTEDAKKSAEQPDEPTKEQEEEAAKDADRVDVEVKEEAIEKDTEDEALESVVLDYATYLDGTSFLCCDEVSGIDYSKIAMDAGPKKKVTRENCETTFAQCRAKNPLFCRYHGPKLLEADIKRAITATLASKNGKEGAYGFAISVTKDKDAKNPMTFRLTVGCSPKQKAVVENIIDQYFRNNPGITSKDGMHQIGDKDYTREFDMDIMLADKPPKKKDELGQYLLDTGKARKKIKSVQETPQKVEKAIAAANGELQQEKPVEEPQKQTEEPSETTHEVHSETAPPEAKEPVEQEQEETTEETIEETEPFGVLSVNEPPKNSNESTVSTEDAMERISLAYADYVEEPVPEWVNSLTDEEKIKYADLLESAQKESQKENDGVSYPAYDALVEFETLHNKETVKKEQQSKNAVIQKTKLGQSESSIEDKKAKLKNFIYGQKCLLKGYDTSHIITFLHDNGDGTAVVQVKTPGANMYMPSKVEKKTVSADDLMASGIQQFGWSVGATNKFTPEDVTEEMIESTADAIASKNGYPKEEIAEDIHDRLSGKKPVKKAVLDLVKKNAEKGSPIVEVFQKLYDDIGWEADGDEAFNKLEEISEDAFEVGMKLDSNAEDFNDVIASQQEIHKQKGVILEANKAMKDLSDKFGDKAAMKTLKHKLLKDSKAKAMESYYNAIEDGEAAAKKLMERIEGFKVEQADTWKGEAAKKVELAVKHGIQMFSKDEDSKGYSPLGQIEKMWGDLNKFTSEQLPVGHDLLDFSDINKAKVNAINAIKAFDEVMSGFEDKMNSAKTFEDAKKLNNYAMEVQKASDDMAMAVQGFKDHIEGGKKMVEDIVEVKKKEEAIKKRKDEKMNKLKEDWNNLPDSGLIGQYEGDFVEAFGSGDYDKANDIYQKTKTGINEAILDLWNGIPEGPVYLKYASEFNKAALADDLKKKKEILGRALKEQLAADAKKQAAEDNTVTGNDYAGHFSSKEYDEVIDKLNLPDKYSYFKNDFGEVFVSAGKDSLTSDEEDEIKKAMEGKGYFGKMLNGTMKIYKGSTSTSSGESKVSKKFKTKEEAKAYIASLPPKEKLQKVIEVLNKKIAANPPNVEELKAKVEKAKKMLSKIG